MGGVRATAAALACALLAASCTFGPGHDSISFTFDIPSVKTPAASPIHSVTARFHLDAAILSATQVKVLPPDQRGNCPSSPCTGFPFTAFYPGTGAEIETDSSDDDAGYLLRLWDRGGGSYELEVRNKMDGPSVYGTWSDGNGTGRWAVTISGLSGSHTLSRDSLLAYDKDAISVTDAAFTTGLQF